MIELRNISLNFDGREVLKNVSLNIERGSTSVILGPSGAGKSTILKVILGLVEISNGEVFVKGKKIFSLNENDLLGIRRKIGIVFQGNALFDSLNVEDNVAYFLAYKSTLPVGEIYKKVDETLSFVNLEGTQKLFPDQLSGGMKKRVAVARALATDPDIILFDEPTTGLDPINSKSVLDLINRLKATGTTSVVVTHILNDAILIGDVLTVINDGRIITTGNVKQILQSEDAFIKDFFYEIYQNTTFINEANK
ncbi:MAG: ATP-binding cassette domain-containing protein [Ignavibacteria bacterium]|jgi:phospholipid/cholesterol/gamma-HCH transport system ATP-binding protein